MSDWRGRIRWFAAEFLAVLTSVLVALGLQALYEGSADRRRETAYLIANRVEADLARR